MKPTLFYFQCRFCKTVLAVTIKSPRPERCRCSGAWMTFLFSEPVQTDEQRVIAKQGRAWNPHNPPQPWTCARCGETFAGTARRIDRPDGTCCTACYAAEEHPPIPLLTAEEIEARRARKAAVRQAQEDRQEAAYQLASKEQS